VNIQQLIDQLCLPQTYPHAVEVITTIETHISVVFLTGQFAYKLKKPVDFGFLNFTEKKDRQFFCQQEVRLNKRTAPDLYLDVVPIYQTLDGQVRLQPTTETIESSEPIDYLVKMNQFEPNWVLGRYLSDNHISLQQERLLAKRIADLHQTAHLAPIDSHLGEPETLLQPMLDNFPTLLKNCSDVYKPRLHALLDWTNQQFSELRPLMVQRKQQGFVRECHGDLHLDNITLIGETPTLFDGIEFNDELRWIDGISDLAFLLIDLDFRGQTAFKNRVLSQYLEMTGDYEALELLDFYKVYRSLVRAKISALRLNQLDSDSLEYQHYKKITIQYIEQAESEAFSKQIPQIVLLQGVSGSGKSYFSKQLLQHIDAVVISSDIERKRLFGIQPTDRVSEDDKQTLYSNEMNRKTYQRLQTLTQTVCEFGLSVVVDATFLKQVHRQKFYDLAAQLGYDAKLIYIDADVQTATQSIEYRQSLNSDPSDASIEVMQRQSQVIEVPNNKDDSVLTLKASELRKFFPDDLIQEFLF